MKPTTQTLKDFLVAQTPTDQYRDTAQYAENVNPDALTDKWIESNTSYIWKVGVLVVADPNKCDWVYLYIGHQRQPSAGFEFIGKLYWRDGENDDIGASLRRYVSLANSIHPVFDE